MPEDAGFGQQAAGLGPQRTGATMPNSNQVTLKQLRYFARVVELGSITRASQDLHVAQTALGLQVRALEDCLGVPLLLRHAKGVSPTEHGRLVYDHALEIVRAVEEMAESLTARLETRPRDIWLGLAPNLMSVIGAQAVVTQAEDIPGVRLHLIEGSRNVLLKALDERELDWAIVHEAEKVEGVRAIPVLRQSLLLVCRAGSGLPPGPVSLRDALSHDLVLDSGKRVISGVLARVAREYGLRPSVKFEVDSVATIKDMIASGEVSGVMSRAIARDEIARGELEGHRITEPPLEMTAYFVTRLDDAPGTADGPVLEFIDNLLDEFCERFPEEEVRLGRLAPMVQPHAAE